MSVRSLVSTLPSPLSICLPAASRTITALKAGSSFSLKRSVTSLGGSCRVPPAAGTALTRWACANAGAVGEQPVEAVGRHAHRQRVEPPPALVALQHSRIAGIKAEPGRVDHRFGERGDIAQAHIEALAGDRVDHMGGVADERQALRDE